MREGITAIAATPYYYTKSFELHLNLQVEHLDDNGKFKPAITTYKNINYRSEVLSSLAFPASGQHVSEQFV